MFPIVQSTARIWLRTLAASAASLFGLNSAALASNLIVAVPCMVALSQLNSNGYKCCTGHSMNTFPARSFTAAQTIPSFHSNNCFTIPSGHSPQFLSSDLIITTSPTD